MELGAIRSMESEIRRELNLLKSIGWNDARRRSQHDQPARIRAPAEHLGWKGEGVRPVAVYVASAGRLA